MPNPIPLRYRLLELARRPGGITSAEAQAETGACGNAVYDALGGLRRTGQVFGVRLATCNAMRIFGNRVEAEEFSVKVDAERAAMLAANVSRRAESNARYEQKRAERKKAKRAALLEVAKSKLGVAAPVDTSRAIKAMQPQGAVDLSHARITMCPSGRDMRFTADPATTPSIFRALPLGATLAGARA